MNRLNTVGRFGTTALGLIAVLAFCGAALADDGKSSGSFGLEIHEKVGQREIGLPIFPGAILRHDRDEDSPSVSFGLWGGAFGLKIVALEYASDGSVEAIASFYRDALAKYGPVIDCSAPNSNAKAGAAKGDGIECEHDHPKPGGRLYKSGTEKSQHVVEINPNGSDVHFSLLRLEIKSDD
jgi:hypothetical protein